MNEIEIGNVPLNEGGCWICHKEDDELRFSTEWDTYYHPKCLEKLGFDSITEFERNRGAFQLHAQNAIENIEHKTRGENPK